MAVPEEFHFDDIKDVIDDKIFLTTCEGTEILYEGALETMQEWEMNMSKILTAYINHGKSNHVPKYKEEMLMRTGKRDSTLFLPVGYTDIKR